MSKISIPDVQVEDPHWKVGDGMQDKHGNPDFIIGQLAMVEKGTTDSGAAKFDIVFFDRQGEEQGRKHFVEDDSGYEE